MKKIFKKIHVIYALAFVLALTFSYFCAKSFVYNKAISYFQSKGIKAKIENVNFGLYSTDLKNVELWIGTSKTFVKKINVSYSMKRIKVIEPNITGNVDDYIVLKNKLLLKNSNSKKQYKTIINVINGSALLVFKNNSFNISNINFNNINYILSSSLIKSTNILVNDIKVNTKLFDISIREIELFSKTNLLNNKDTKDTKSISFNIPNIKDTIIGSVNNIITINIGIIKYKQSLTKNTIIRIYNSNYWDVNIVSNDTLYQSLKNNDFILAKKINLSFTILNDKTNIELYIDDININNNKISSNEFNIKKFSLITDGLTIKNGDIFFKGKYFADINKIPLSGNAELNSNSVNNFSVIMYKTLCSNVITSLPEDWKDLFGNATYDGYMSFSLIGHSLKDIKLNVNNTCKFINVPEKILKKTLSKPFYISFERKNPQLVGPGTAKWVPLNMISEYMERSLLTTEDGTFFTHSGINTFAIADAVVGTLNGNNPRGGSTITMQLAKNLWLDSSKNLSRKIEEYFLTIYLESIFTKYEILEMYLNVVEFGPGIYGIHDAAKHYFKTVPMELSLKQSLFLTSILPRPKVSYFKNGELGPGTKYKLNMLLNTMEYRGKISVEEMENAKKEILIAKI